MFILICVLPNHFTAVLSRERDEISLCSEIDRGVSRKEGALFSQRTRLSAGPLHGGGTQVSVPAELKRCRMNNVKKKKN